MLGKETRELKGQEKKKLPKYSRHSPLGGGRGSPSPANQATPLSFLLLLFQSPLWHPIEPQILRRVSGNLGTQ